MLYLAWINALSSLFCVFFVLNFFFLAFLIYSHVLSLGSVGADQTYVSTHGFIFVKNPDCVLAIESSTALKPRKPKYALDSSSNIFRYIPLNFLFYFICCRVSVVSFSGPQLTSYPLFFMPCFQKVLGTTSDTETLMR